MMTKLAHTLLIFAGMSGLGLVQITAMAAPPDSLVTDVTGNVGIGTATPGAPLEITRGDDTARVLIRETGTGGNQELLRLSKTSAAPIMRYESAFGMWDFSAGYYFVINDPADAPIEFKIDSAGNLTLTGTLTEGSSRERKDNIVPVNPRAILDKVLVLPIAEWSYREGGQQVRHMGPMAEDFSEAFGLGSTNTGISTLDSSGVALVAIQGLEAKLTQQLAAKDARIETLEANLAELKQLVHALAARAQLVDSR